MRKLFTSDLLLFLFVFVFGASAQGLVAQCAPDITPPVLDCSITGPSNMLLNNSFEEPPVHDRYGADSWVPFGAAFSVDQNAIGFAQDGKYFMKLFGGNSGLFQDHPISPGDIVSASVFVQNASWDRMFPGCAGFLKLEFFDAGGGFLGFSESSKLDNTIPLDTWTPIVYNDTAPAGAATVRMVVIMQCTGRGAVMFDNASLTNLSAPGNPLGNIVVYADPDDCGADLKVGVPLATDNCGLFPGGLFNSRTGTGDASGFYPIGTTRLLWSVFDNSFLTDTCSFTITVIDSTAPKIECNPVPQVNILDNNSFEQNSGHDKPFGTQWFAFGPAFTLDDRLIGNAQDGNFFLKTFGAVSGITQDKPVQPGDRVTASVYVQSASFDRMLPGCVGISKLEFLDGNKNVIQFKESDRVEHTIPLDTWVQASVTDVAPPPAVEVRTVVVMLCPAGGAVMFDNAETFISSGSSLPAVVLDNESGQCDAMVSIPYPSLSDNCTVDSSSLTNDFNNQADASDRYPVGTTVVEFSVNDDSGNMGKCSFEVTVNDVEPPVMTSCPQSITTCGDGINIISYMRPTFDDNCGGMNQLGTLVSGLDSGAVFPIGITDVRWIFVDQGSNADTCSFSVTIGGIPDAPDTTITRCGLDNVGLNLQAHVDMQGNGVPSNFTWMASPVAGVGGLSTSPQTGPVITDVLDNTTGSPVTVVYTVMPVSSVLDSCVGQSFTVTVNLQENTSLQTTHANICQGGVVDIARLVRDFSLTATMFSFYDDDPAAGGQLVGRARAFRGMARTSDRVIMSPAASHTYYVTSDASVGCTGAITLAISFSFLPSF
jgi:hypothetical protein